jgi:hypothetical protein
MGGRGVGWLRHAVGVVAVQDESKQKYACWFVSRFTFCLPHFHAVLWITTA